MKLVLVFLGSLLFLSPNAQGPKKPAKHDDAEADHTILVAGDVAAFSLTQAEAYQFEEDSKYVPPEPAAKEKTTQPGILMFKNSDGTEGLTQDWTTGQHARSLLESLRVSMYRYQAGKPNPAGVIGVHQAVEVWPKLRRIYCREYPGGRYI